MIYRSPSGAPEYSINDDLKQNLDILLNGVLKYNQDAVIVVDGEEGSGKSQGIRQIALYCADQLGTGFDRAGLGNVHTSMAHYIDAFENSAKKGVKGYVGVLDESRAVLGKARFNSREVKAFTDWLSECRDLCGVHIILLPRFHDLAKYVVLNRMHMLVSLHKKYRENPGALGGQDLILGSYKVYGNDAALVESYFNPYRYPRGFAASDRFNDVEVMTPKGLELLKVQKQKDRDNRRKLNTETGLDKGTVWLNALLAILQAQGHQAVSFAKLFGITRQAINQRLHAGRQTIIYAKWKQSNESGAEDPEKT